MKYIALITAAVMLSAMTVGCGSETDPVSPDIPSRSETSAPRTEEIPTPEETSAPEETSSPETEEISAPEETSTPEETTFADLSEDTYVEYHFRTRKQLEQHFEKHGGEFGSEFGYNSPEDYEAGASSVINDPDALFKTEAEDGDGVYYIESSNEFVILSTDGYIRTYFRPTAGISYFNRQ